MGGRKLALEYISSELASGWAHVPVPKLRPNGTFSLMEAYRELESALIQCHSDFSTQNYPRDIDSAFNDLEAHCETVSGHPLLDRMNSYSLNQSSCRYFAAAFYAHIYHAFEDVLFGICLCAPPYPELREFLIKNLWEEFGSGDAAACHLRVYENSLLKVLSIQPLSRTDVEQISRGPENELSVFARLYGLKEAAIWTAINWTDMRHLPFRASLGATVFGSELTPKFLFPSIISCLSRSSLPDNACDFFRLHLDVDGAHFLELKRVLRTYVLDFHHLIQVLAGVRLMIQIRHDLFSHLLQELCFI